MKSEFSPEHLKQAEHQSALCRIFANPLRVLIVWFLAEEDRTVTELALAIGASMQSASQHLRIMEYAGLVVSRREHHNIFYHLLNPDLPKLFNDETQHNSR